jgi:hypothetical protein
MEGRAIRAMAATWNMDDLFIGGLLGGVDG